MLCPVTDALISRDVLFGNPDKAMARLSPDGARVAFLAPDDGVLNVFVAPRDDPSAAEAVTGEGGVVADVPPGRIVSRLGLR